MHLTVSKNSLSIASIIVFVPALLFVVAAFSKFSDMVATMIGLSNYKFLFAGVFYFVLSYCGRKLLHINKSRLERIFTFRSNGLLAKAIAYLDGHLDLFESDLSSSRKVYVVGIFFLWLALLVAVMVSTEESIYLLIEPIAGLLTFSLILHFMELRWYRQDQRRKIQFVPWRPEIS